MTGIKTGLVLIVIFLIVITVVRLNIVEWVTEDTRRKQKSQNTNLYRNFNTLCGPVVDINPEFNYGVKRVNCERTQQGEYTVVSLPDVVPMVMSNQKQGVRAILERVLPHVQLANRSITMDDVVVIDIIEAKGAYFPSIHTDIEWQMYPNEGFQVWMLLENPKRDGNMFIFETDTDQVAKDGGGVAVRGDGGKLVLRTATESDFSRGKELRVKRTSYLDFRSGDCIIMNQNLLHMSDFRGRTNNRRAINFRVLIRKPDRSIAFSTRHEKNMWWKLYNVLQFRFRCSRMGVCPLFGPSV